LLPHRAPAQRRWLHLDACTVSTSLQSRAKMPFKRYVKIGRVAQINYGKEYGRLIVIVDVIDQNKVTPPPPPKISSCFVDNPNNIRLLSKP
ncbi:putative 60S ribosomal protein L14, partial [Glycine soja]